jgi:hypothetical protein
VTDKTKSLLVRLGSFLLAAGLLYFALRNVDLKQVGRDLSQANYWWAFPVVFVTLFSHWLRAWRWTFLLDQLPTGPPDKRGREPKRVDILGAFGAVMIGYLANYVAPRVGEVVRTASVSTRFHRPFTAVLGTVITERILDVVTMALALLTIPLVFSGRIWEIRDLLVAPLQDKLPYVSPWIILATTLAVVAAGFALFRWIQTGHGARIARILAALRDGLATVALTPRRVELVVSTLLIWLCYGTMAYLPFLMFGFDVTYGIGYFDAWGIMLLGAIGVVIPSPGGFGSFHYITIQSLVLLFAFSSDAAASYAILTHTGQLLIYVITGAVFVLGMGLRFSGSAGEPALE